jgi:ABC-type dipeptide/oligopeptide/nickel transport system ATPase component
MASEESLVVFTAGGAGSGKSTSVSSIEQFHRNIAQAQIVVDATLSSQLSLEQIKMALDAGKAVKIFYIYRDPELAFNGVLERANRTGRPVTISNFIDTHLGAPAALDNVTERFGQEIKSGTIEVLVIDNNGDIKDAKLVQDGVVFVGNKTKGYSEDGLRRRLHDLLKIAYDKGRISKEDFERMDK